MIKEGVDSTLWRANEQLNAPSLNPYLIQELVFCNLLIIEPITFADSNVRHAEDCSLAIHKCKT